MNFEKPNFENLEIKKEERKEETFEPRFKGKYYEGQENPAKIEDDARYRHIFEKHSLDYLKNKDKDWFESRFGGIADSGYLFDKNGQETNILPSQNITVGYDEVKDAALFEFMARYPEDAKNYGIHLKEGEIE
jgi:hypothetical protein